MSTAAGPTAERAVRPKTRARTEQILRVAHDVFSERGYEGASITEIAGRAGVAEGTIYKHFASKKDLVTKVLVRYYTALIAELEANIARMSGTANRLRYIIHFQLEGLIHQSGISKVFLREIRSQAEYFDSAVLELNRRYTEIAVRVVEEGIAAGEVRPDFPARLARYLVYGTIEHIGWRAMSGRGNIQPDEVADDLTDLFLRGMAPGDHGAADPLAANLQRLEALIARLEARLDTG